MKKVLVVLLVLVSAFLLMRGYANYQHKLDKIASAAYKSHNLKEKKASLEKTIQDDLPGIVIWGDTQTAGGEGYPTVLQELIRTNVYDIPVINMGIDGESTNTMMGRAGSAPFIVEAFTIPEDGSKVEINLHSSTGKLVAPLRLGDTGINPVTIAGVEGTLSIEQESSTSIDFHYYFQRTQTGSSVDVENGSTIQTAASTEQQNYIPIVFMGQNGGYKNGQELIDQINSIVKMEKYNDKFLVLGLASGTSKKRAALEDLMKATFGDNYINLREDLSTNGLEKSNIQPTAADQEAMENGDVPPSLLTDEDHVNASGEKVIGQAIYERMQELGYFDQIKKLSDEVKGL